MAVLAAAVLVAGCPRVDVGSIESTPGTETAEPLVRVGLGLPQTELAIGGGAGLVVTGADGGGLFEVPAGVTAAISGDGASVRARIGGVATSSATALTIRPLDSVGFVRVGGREFRGELRVTPTPTGLLAVNLVSLEAYVAGVVNAEMGRRPPGDSEAVYAQAIISRTVAVRALGRYRVRGYDVVSTVSDQAYGGVGTETAMGWEAVRATRAQVLTYNGAVIEAFFHSTCGGRTEAVDAVFSGGAQPYLQSVSDRDANGQAFCALSPRFRWREEWTGETVSQMLRDGRVGGGGPIADLQVGARSPSGRVTELVAVAGGRAVPIEGQQTVRQLLRASDGGWIRSTQFSLQVTRGGGRIVRAVAEGGGNGHGVGMCQWGAVGRARAGADHQAILAAYFPGTEIRRIH